MAFFDRDYAGSSEDGYALTKSDTPGGQIPFRRLYIGGTGDVKIRTLKGNDVLYKAVPVGYLYVQGDTVYSTLTTATNIVAEI